MKRPTRRRNAVGIAMTLVTFALGVMLAVSVTGSASASSTGGMSADANPNSPSVLFTVINGTVNAATDHEIVGSSAFPNFTTGAVDNYYTMAHTHVDNSPFAEGTASPFDTGPIGQTAAAGNFQQTQYADARWPGGPAKASFGSQGAPFAEAGADNYVATADASEPSRAFKGPALTVPKGFDSRLDQALAAWKTKYLGCPALPKKPPLPAVTPPKPKVPKVQAPKPGVTTPTATVTTPVATVKTPSATGVTATSTPQATVPTAPAVPSAGTSSRSLASVPSLCSSPTSSSSGDGEESLLTSSTMATVVPGAAADNANIAKINPAKLEATRFNKSKTDTLVSGGESSLGHVTLGGGQIRIEGIHVSASIANDGTRPNPAYKASVSIAAASIGGVPVTIDQDGVHVSGHSQGLPYQQASDALNTALNKAGIQLFLVSPEVTTSSCGSSGTGTGSGSGTDTTSTTTSTTSSDQSGMSGSCGSCDQSGAGAGGGTGTTQTTTTTSTTSTTSSDQSGSAPPSGSCDSSGAGAGCAPAGTTSGNSGSSGGTPIGGVGTGTTPSSTTTTTSTTSTTSTDQSSTSSAPSWCLSSAPPAGGSPCPSTGAKKTSSSQSTTTDTTSSGDQAAAGAGTGSSPEETVTATGLHIVFTQPVSPPGVPAQFVEHILGEVFVDSLATPAPPLPNLNLSATSLSSSPCGGSHVHGGAAAGGSGTSAAGGGGGSGSVAGGSMSSASGSGSFPSGAASGSGIGSGSQPGSGSGVTGLPARFAAALKKPLWLLLAYVLWQALVVGTGVSLWNWRREEGL